ncbi:MAG TPA: hypothetical protein VE222_06620, partial [Nitrospiraceae bacterium]|nr:hypothetical protein [Nitrospiraceae bacterium]
CSTRGRYYPRDVRISTLNMVGLLTRLRLARGFLGWSVVREWACPVTLRGDPFQFFAKTTRVLSQFA